MVAIMCLLLLDLALYGRATPAGSMNYRLLVQRGHLAEKKTLLKLIYF